MMIENGIFSSEKLSVFMATKVFCFKHNLVISLLKTIKFHTSCIDSILINVTNTNILHKTQMLSVC